MDNNINVFKNGLKNKKSNITYMENNNIVYDNMTSKTVKPKLENLKTLAKDVKNVDLKQKADNIVKLYAERKISRVEVPKNLIIDFITYGDQTPRKQKAIDTKYNKLVKKIYRCYTIR